MKKIKKILDIIESELQFPNIHLIKDSHINSLKEIDNKLLIVELFQNFDSRFANALLLTLPQIWKELNLNDWVEVVKSVIPGDTVQLEKDIFKNIQNDRSFGDIIFISFYLGIDPVKVISEIEKTDARKRKLKFISLYPFKFVSDPNIIKEDLDDFYALSYDELNSYTNNIDENFVSEFKNPDQLKICVEKHLNDMNY